MEGAQPDPPSDTPVGTDTTNDLGKYSVIPQGGFASPGDFYAKVQSRTLASGRCRTALSPVISNP